MYNSLLAMPLITIFAVIGILTTACLGLLFLWYIVTRKPTPNATVKEAVTSIRWSYAIALFIAPLSFVGYMEGTPVVGFLFGFGFVAFMVALQWWMGPV